MYFQCICLLCVGLLIQADSNPLPELKQFLAAFRKTLHTDDVLLSEYTYTETRTHTELKSDGKPGKMETDAYRVTRGSDGAIYRLLVSKNDVPVPAGKPQKVEVTQRKDEQRILDDVFAGYDMQIVGREDLDSRPAIRIRFVPRTGYSPETRLGKIMQHVAGEAWINEADHQLARIDAEVIDPISIGFGFLARLQKGAAIHAERRKINGEVWLPHEAEVSLSARILLLKGLHFSEKFEYSDYKKFVVETTIKPQ